MPDIKNPTLIWIKGILFLLLGLFASVLLVLHTPTVTVALLLCLSVWAFCRFYYFAFYVIQNYVDSQYRFLGLLSLLHYAISKRRRNRQNAAQQNRCLYRFVLLPPDSTTNPFSGSPMRSILLCGDPRRLRNWAASTSAVI